MSKISKADFVELVKKIGEYPTKKEADKAIETVTKAMVEVMKHGNSVTIPLFGTISVVKKAEKSGKIPGSNKTYTKPAHLSPKIEFSKAVKEHLQD